MTWTNQLEKEFQTLKTDLSGAPVVTIPDMTSEFILQTDASERGVGAVLSQRDKDGVEKPIAYFSRKLLPRETRYAVVEKECAAIVAALKHFEVYLVGRKFVVQTDHHALQYLDQTKSSNGHLARWALMLQPFDFEIRHRPGRDNANADGLSRQSWNDSLQPREEGGDVRDAYPDTPAA